MRMIKLLLLILAFTHGKGFAQNCDCSTEFLYIKNFMENNYAGFKDKLSAMKKPVYEKMTNVLLKQTRNKYSRQKCLFLISQYLENFKDDHIQVSAKFDATKLDSGFISQGEKIELTDERIAELRRSENAEGIYYFKHDSSYKIALIKNKSLLRDYTGVIVDSKLPSWKKGQIKFEARQLNDSMLKGVLYMRNHMPKVEWFYLGKNSIGGDWQREGTEPEKYSGGGYVPVASKKISDRTVYIKISSFSASNAKNIDSLFKANQQVLDTIPYIVLDLRNNGGGADFAYLPILPYIYTNPVKTIGVDVLSTDATITGWKKLLEDEDIPEQSKKSISIMIDKMERSKGKLVNIVDDETDSTYKVLKYPQKVVVLINKGCASTTEQFLLTAKQSAKVILLGENTQGTLDYSNMREAPFSCLPYVLRYATTRSRRLDSKQGIDNVGIKPDVYLKPGADWINEAVKMLEK